MQTVYTLNGLKGFNHWYNYAYKHTHMITKGAEQRLKILRFWREYGLKATRDAFGAKRSTLFWWWKIYVESGREIQSLNPKTQARKTNHKREIHPLILKEIRRLRLEECPNMGKAKVKKNLDKFCKQNHLSVYSESKIGRIIKEKKIYHHRQKVFHDGTIKIISKREKERKPKDFRANKQGDLIEIDIKTEYSFAYCYRDHGSGSAKDFFKKLEQVFPYRIKAIQTDNGSEFHKYFADYLENKKITHYWNYKGQPTKNGYVERFNRTIQEEFIDWNEIWLNNTDQFNQRLMDWLLWYNTKRFHWSLNLTSPMDYLLNNMPVSNMSWTNTVFLFNLIM